MSLKPLQSHLTQVSSLYAPYYASGGGGGSTFASASISSLTVSSINGGSPGGGSGPVLTVSTLNVSSILGNGPGGALELNAPGAIYLNAGAGAAVELATAGRIDFGDSLGRLTGVSSINGAAYPPPGAAAAVSSVVNASVTVGSALTALGPGVTGLTGGEWYLGMLNLDSATIDVIGAPTEGDHAGILFNTTQVGVIDLVQLSSIKGRGQPYSYSFTAPFTTIAGANQFLAYCNATATASTILGSDSGVGWMMPLQ